MNGEAGQSGAYETLVEQGARALAPRLPERSDAALRAYSRKVLDATLPALAQMLSERADAAADEGAYGDCEGLRDACSLLNDLTHQSAPSVPSQEADRG